MAHTTKKLMRVSLEKLIHEIKSFHFDEHSNEFFITGSFGHIAVLSAEGDLLGYRELDEWVKIIGQRHTPDGWCFICKSEERWLHCIFDNESIVLTVLEGTIENPTSPCWSSCGRYVAVGSDSSGSGNAQALLSVWETNTGMLRISQNVHWNIDEKDMINPPILKAVSWIDDDKKIVCSTRSPISLGIMIFNMETKSPMTIIE